MGVSAVTVWACFVLQRHELNLHQKENILVNNNKTPSRKAENYFRIPNILGKKMTYDLNRGIVAAEGKDRKNKSLME